ncbi:protein of unknown function [Bradyrhizobium sp. Rc2d]|uniref:ImmA/IrrE family metallo-endopeptidase n=1 Tax=Bradyrhizobium sp. Rc2d TaxID=1855321 RepID=UPI00087E5E15|nr:ImmA/IrrE family metallo-endopeptidase [Bradyrhizobium sp. Rc2d]SDJ62551.1 protein of unknown function [Bradyrhizobium sp. Rc2d]
MNYSAPSPCGLPKAVVDKFASDVAAHFGYQPGDELSSIVAKLGGRILSQNILDFGRFSSGSIRIEREGSFEILLASHTGRLRDRFTIAHELGHYFLHFIYAKRNGAQIERMEALRYGSGQVEWEANWFAAGFLMPASAFREAHASMSGSIARVADRFGVSSEAANIRAQYLGLAA